MKLKAREIPAAALFTAMMAAGAFVRIPFPILPLTLQPFICALAGLILGHRLGALSMTVYAFLGLSGLPVFANGGGISYVLDKSFGFIAGFIAGAFVIGKISEKLKTPSVINTLKALIPGLIVIYTIGMSYMFLIMRIYMGNRQAGLIYVLGVNFPYIIKDLILYFAIAAAGTSPVQAAKKAMYQ